LRNKHDFPSPGEHSGSEHIQAEANVAVPDGEMLGMDPMPDQRRCTLELPPVMLRESNDYEELIGRSALRRTGTEQVVRLPGRSKADLTEQRRDRSTHDTQRENWFDPAQDDSGPQSDQN
jgi:hypothetical protein